MRKNHSKIVCINLVHLPYFCNSFQIIRLSEQSGDIRADLRSVDLNVCLGGICGALHRGNTVRQRGVQKRHHVCCSAERDSGEWQHA